METVAIVAHVPLRAAAIRVPIVAVVGIPHRAAAIRAPIVAAVGIPHRAAAIRVPIVAAEAVVDIQLPAGVEVEVVSTPPEATTGLITDDKNFELLPGGPPSRPLFVFSFCLSASSFARGAPTLACSDKSRFCGAESVSIPSFVLLTADGE
jgi:hypothetical protein